MTLRDAALVELERVYATHPVVPLPGGVWRGHYLHELPMSLADRMVARAMFKWPRFGLDLDRFGWWFGRPGSVIGRFEPRIGGSRWRDADVVRLDYRRTTPWPLRRMLYDELKPLSNDCILGLGGVNRTRGGAWFYFLLERP